MTSGCKVKYQNGLEMTQKGESVFNQCFGGLFSQAKRNPTSSAVMV
jgi:hypothetical protein